MCLQSDPSAKGMKLKLAQGAHFCLLCPPWGFLAQLNFLSILASTGDHEKGQEPRAG